MRLRERLVWVAVLTALALLLPAGSSHAYGSSITSPGTPATGALAVSDAQWAAFLAGHGELAGASAAAPIASAVGTAGLALAGGSVVSGDGLGGITGLLGGVKNWFIGTPSATDPGLPPGVGAAGNYLGSTPWNVQSVTFGSSSVTIRMSRPAANGGVRCYAVDSSGVAKQSHGAGSMGVYNTVYDYVGTTITPTLGHTWVGIRCFLGVASNLYPTSPTTLTGAGIATWAPGATAASEPVRYGAFPGGPSPDPLRHIEQTVTCKRADGSTSTVTNSTSGAAWGASAMVEVAGLMCPLGSRAVGVTATVKTEGGADLVVVNEPYVPGAGWDSLTGSIPEPCYSGTTCYLDLQRKTGADTWAKVDPESVPDWWADPLRDSLYRCVYGAGAAMVVLPIASCEVYRSPDTGLAKPTTPTGTTPPTTDTTGDCTFSWSSLFNGEIFVRGSRCVLRWAFVPSAGFAPVLGRFGAAWNGSPIGVWVGDVGGAGGDLGGALVAGGSGSCQGPVYALRIGDFDEDFAPFSTCSEPFATIAPIFKGVLTILLVFAGVRVILRKITRAADLPSAPGA